MCTQPVTIKYSNITGTHCIQVPCGKCTECKKQYQSDWAVRMYVESHRTYIVDFITLTYSEDCVPTRVFKESGEVFRTVYKPHVQNWLKRAREIYYLTYRKRAEFKYFVTSEYGPRTLRPHYHLLLFGCPLSLVEVLLKDWQKRYGFTNHKHFNFTPRKGEDSPDVQLQKITSYVAKYCSKGVFENPLVSEGKVFPTFHLISKGLGDNYINQSSIDEHHLNGKIKKYKNGKYSDAYLEALHQRMKFYYYENLRPVHLPRYYKIRLYATKILDHYNSKSGNPVYQYITQNKLLLAYQDYVLRQFDRRIIEKSKLISTKNPSYSFERCYGLALDSLSTESFYRDIESTQRLGKFYDKSKL